MPIDSSSIYLSGVWRDRHNCGRQSEFIYELKRIVKKLSSEQIRHTCIRAATNGRRRFVHDGIDTAPLQ